ncbi:MAG: alanine--tRNA ligase-related protein [Cellulosilyticum sp.]|nr:alanine--tRNA ligase-related protein [Cellulosilyticum sp.]
MTKKLYYKDAYMTKFTGKVLSCEEGKKGIAVVLDQTAFYPEGGGQPADMGILGNAKVSYVFIKDEVIYHVVDKALEVGKEVEGVIDFERRFDFMQQHSGEHILSGLINAKYGYNNVGFHLSIDYTTCDFDGELTKEQIQEIEILANESIYQNLAIDCTIYNDQEIKEKPYRSKLDLVGDVRLVTVPNYDTCACCGTHVKMTGEIGMIKCTNVERHRGGTRVTVLCGKRALQEAQQKQTIMAEVSQMLSAKPEVITSNLAKLQQELAEMKQRVASLTNELFEYKVEEYLKTEEPAIYVYEKDLAGDALRRLCLMLVEKTDKKVLVLTGEEGNLKYALGAKSMDVRPLNKCLTSEFNGKGGGKSELCQGSLVGNEAEIRSFYLLHHGA